MRPPRSARRDDRRVNALTRFLIDVARDWFGRFVAVQGLDRAMAIGAQAYTALVPLLIVYSSLLPRADNEDFADVLIKRFELTGSTAASFKQVFAPAGAVESGVTFLGVGLLIVAALSFTRGLQRLYELAYELPTLGIKNTPRGLLWLLVVTIVAGVRPIVLGPFGGALLTVLSLAFGVGVWLVTPYLLLGRRVAWQTLLPGALLTAIGMIGVGIYSVIWMPHALASSARQYGIIGIGFALLAWLVAVSSVIVVTTTGGAILAERLGLHSAAGDDTPAGESASSSSALGA
jgi:membrane protein